MKTKVRAVTSGKISNREKENKVLARKAASEGIVLLKNNGVLPINKKNIALYGNGARKTIKGGTGSGDVQERHSVSIEEGLEHSGFIINTKKYIDDFDLLYQSEFKKWDENIQRLAKNAGPNEIFEIISKNQFHFPIGRKILEEDIIASNCDTAIYVIARQAGEGKDRRHESGDYQITEVEYDNIKLIADRYKNTIIIINIGGMIDLTFVDEIQGIDALLYFVQGGQEGGSALTDILSGKVSPSGKLTDTWGKNYLDYPSSDTYSYMNKDVTNEEYKEGIYVGYRYFDSFQVQPRYEFGYGMSYTDFSIKVKQIDVKKEDININIIVQNTGEKYCGKEVVQLYVSAPGKRLPREYQSLVAFKKTEILKPGEEHEILLTFKLSDVAAYDEEHAAWILEEGSYIIRMGNSSRNTKQIAQVILEDSVQVEKATNICKVQKSLNEIIPPTFEWAQADPGIPSFVILKKDILCKENNYNKLPITTDKTLRKLVHSLTLKELTKLIVGGGQSGKNKNLTPGAVGRTTSALWKKGIPNINMTDGPAGVNVQQKSIVTSRGREKYLELPPFFNYGFLKKIAFLVKGNEKQGTVHYQFCTAWPVATLMAQTWNLDLLQEVGKGISKELDEIGATLWLAPGMNIHRNPLCGRNFEYYSEDPYLTGKLAAAITKGVQSIPGIGTTIKHFVCNNQEDNRMYVSSDINERALREIYLKGFRIAVEESKPLAVMTSYNRLNGIYTANSYDLCTKVLRNEWGYCGLVMSDWYSTGEGKADYAACAKAGNDIIMPGDAKARKAIIKSIKQKDIEIEDVKRCAANVLHLVFSSKVYTEEND